jgi:hypothetical protein
VFETGGVDKFERVETFDGGEGAEVGEAFNDLAEVDLPVHGVVDSQSHLI